MSLSLGLCRGQWKSSLFLFQPAVTIMGKSFLSGLSVTVIPASMKHCICVPEEPADSVDLLCRFASPALLHGTLPLKGWVSEHPRRSCWFLCFHDRNHLEGGGPAALQNIGGSAAALCFCCHCRYLAELGMWCHSSAGASCDLQLMYFWCVVSHYVLAQVRW